MVKFIVQRKWSPTRRKFLNKWEIRDGTTKRLLHTSNSHMAAVKWLRKRSK